MTKIRRRPYGSLVDFSEVYEFMIQNYSVIWKRETAVNLYGEKTSNIKLQQNCK